jgi:hypothetical protein
MKQILNKLLFVFALVMIGNLLPLIAKADTAYIGSGVYAIMNIGTHAGTNADPFYPGEDITIGGGFDCSGVCTYLVLGADLSSTATTYSVALGVPSSSLLAMVAPGGGSGGGGITGGGANIGSLPSGFTTLVSVGSPGMSYPYGSTTFAVPSTQGTYFINFADGHSFKYSIPIVDKIVPCATDTYTCLGGTVVSRVSPPVCNFSACPDVSKQVFLTPVSPSVIYHGSTLVRVNAQGNPICFRNDTGDSVNPNNGYFDTGSLSSTSNFSVTCNWPTSYCEGTVSSGPDNPTNGESCANFSKDSCGTSWDSHGCHWTGNTSAYYETCFVADTFVDMADGTKKNIQDVKLGDVLKGDKTNNTVIGFHQPKLGSKLLYSFNGGRYFVTAEHPFKTVDGWKSINPDLTMSENIGITVTELKVDDTLITDHGNVLLKTIDSKSDASDTQLYNFLLNGDHTYYADGYLVHNKAQCILANGLYCNGSYSDPATEFCIGAGGQVTNNGTCPLHCSPNGTIYGSCLDGSTLACIGGYRMCVQ